MIVLGVDPGTQITGYGVVARGADRRPVLVECGAIRPTPGGALAERLLEIFEGVAEVIERTRPDVLCVEGVFYGRNVRTTVILGHARGAVMLAAAGRGIPVVEYPPAVVKSAVVGTGKAEKEQVAFMVQEHLSLAEPPTPLDAADGVALALCHLFRDSPENEPPRPRRGAGRRQVD
ncbi:MAG: crossover junction endodeoxyribonuclease RuvC [Gemmatimonadota bacterium]|nr:MAG: crossover junction endodeoxyribonuclease RuvC [Gemmatimonadota bacterium]